ncbi:MAG: gliding motility-associated C-terminal domain-containing protein [Cyclobacteriaceae bacterium]
MKHLKIFSCVALFLIAFTHHSQATHLRAGEITVERVSCNGLTFRITITAYTNTGSPVKFSDGTLSFGDGTSIQTPTVENTIRPELGAGIGYVQFETTHVFPGPGYYVISYKERNRNAGILNMSNSVNTQFYLETVIIIDPFIGCDNSPRLLVPPIDKGCTGGAWYHNPGAYDPDGDSLSYEFVIPKQDKGVPVNNYRDPNVKEFYDRIGLNYSASNQDQSGPPTFSIDRFGTILWDAPGAPGEYNIAFRIIQWRKIGDTFKQIGYVTRDMQIIIEDCKNRRPELTVPQKICVEAGTSIDKTIFGNDPDPLDSLKIEAFSEVFQLSSSPATYSPNPPKLKGPPRPVKLQFKWLTQCSHIKDQPYQVVFKISDKSSQGPSLVQFKTWQIKIVGPKPIWKTANLDLATRSAKLEWESYKCAANAVSMEVWRRVDSYPAKPDSCTTGMPDSFGYTKIATLPIGTTKYTNTGLASGAKYCYRLVAVFPAPKGGKSIVSDEICLDPFKADRAVITNVTVDKTDDKNGEITVKWLDPFDIDKVQFPPDYEYEVYRAEGFSGKIKLTKVNPGRLVAKNEFKDNGLNTRDVIYNYRIFGYAKNDNPIDSSAVASSVRLEIKPKFEEIELRWAANVPWSNNTLNYPTHIIYRTTGGTAEQIIAQVNVNQKGFVFNDTGLKNTESYCYRVETKGSYGNPKIVAPLLNLSQISCAQPDDKIPPCKPVIAATGINCDDYRATSSCSDAGVYSNTLSWKRPFDATCALDIKSYSVYYAARVGDEFKKLTVVVTDTFFVHTNIPSFAGCYKISAVDRAGNESELSDEFCFDNCPYYELPNVFTPNGDKCNDIFSAYSTRNIIQGEVIKSQCGDLTGDQLRELQAKCARFVSKVSFTVYNRWGGVVYRYESGGEKTIYIDWDGRDNSNKDLAAGVYYYDAQVTFDVVDPSKQNRIIKGWVQVLR